MSTNNGGPAFPVPNDANVNGQEGMTLREYAAIHLRQPDSGYEWLDKMILAAKRDELAAKAMQSIISTLKFGIQPSDLTDICFDCYLIADAMLAEREKGGAK